MADFTDLLKASYMHVMNSERIQDLINSGIIGRDVAPNPIVYPYGWVFTSMTDDKPMRDVEGTGKCAVVLTYHDHWSPQTLWHSSKFPRLNVLIYADASRDTSGMITRRDAEDKAKLVWRAIDPLFHDSANRIRFFEDLAHPKFLPIVSTVEGIAFSILEVPKGDGAVRASVSYDITLL